jgi:hypothetical protein
LIQKAKQKVDIKILVWEPRPIVRMLPNSRKRGLEERDKKLQAIRDVAKRFGIEDFCFWMVGPAVIMVVVPCLLLLYHDM